MLENERKRDLHSALLQGSPQSSTKIEVPHEAEFKKSEQPTTNSLN